MSIASLDPVEDFALCPCCLSADRCDCRDAGAVAGRNACETHATVEEREGDMTERWGVRLLVDGKTVDVDVVIAPPFGIKKADAEVKAIKAALAAGGKDVRALDSWPLGTA